MSTTVLGNHCVVVRGSSPRPKGDPRYYGPGVPRLLVADLTRDGKQVSALLDSLTKEGAKKSRPMSKGDIVIAVSGNPGLPAIINHDLCIHDGFVGLRSLSDEYVSNYVYWFLKYFHEQIKGQAVGAIFKNLTTDQIKNIEIPLPPLSEQKRIAGILDAADKLRTKRRESIALLDSLLQSSFLDMFGDPLTNPMEWDVVPLGMAVRIQGGFAFKSKDYVEAGTRLVKIANVHSGTLMWKEVDYVPTGFMKKYKDYLLETGDMVIALTRPIIKSLNSVKIATVGEIDSPCLLNQRVARFILSEDSAIEDQYLLAFTRTQFFKNRVEKFSSVSLQPNISTKQLGDLMVNIPPITLQRKYSKIASAVGKEQVRLAYYLENLDLLFSSLQQRAFNGTL